MSDVNSTNNAKTIDSVFNLEGELQQDRFKKKKF